MSKEQVKAVIGGIEEGLKIPPNERSSKYEFGLNELNENQARFVAPPEGMTLEQLKIAVRNSIEKERRHRDYRQNFIMRNAEKDGYEGVRVYCVSIQDRPMKASAKVNKVA